MHRLIFYILFVALFSYIGSPVFANQEVVQNKDFDIHYWAGRIEKAFQVSDSVQIGFIKNLTYQETVDGLEELKRIRKSLGQIDTSSLNLFEQLAHQSFLKKINRDIWQDEHCEGRYKMPPFENRLLFKFFNSIEEQINRDPTRQQPILDLVEAFARQRGQLQVRLEQIVKDKAYPMFNDFEFYLIEGEIHDYWRNYQAWFFSNFKWQSCSDCKMDISAFYSYLEEVVFEGMSQTIEYYRENINTQSHNYLFPESLEAHNKCRDSWFLFYTEDEKLSPETLKTQALADLEKIEIQMEAELLEIMDRLSIQPVDNENIETRAEKIRYYGAIWGGNAEKVQSSEHFQAEIEAMYQRAQSQMDQIIDSPVNPVDLITHFVPHDPGMGASYKNDPHHPVAQFSIDAETPLLAQLAIVSPLD